MPTTHDELREIIHNGENSAVEFKRDVIQSHELAKELVAFSNFAGGMVLLGIEPDGGVSGIIRDNSEEWVKSACRDKIRPAIIPCFETVRDVMPGKDVGIVLVTPGFNVHTVWHNHKHNYYVRVGSESREPTPDELARLFRQRGEFRVELRPVSGATIADLDMRRLRDYFVHVRSQDAPDDEDLDAWKTLLYNTEIMVEDGITVAGILLFGRNPNRFLPQAGIDAVAYQGAEKDYAAVGRQTIRTAIMPIAHLSASTVGGGFLGFVNSPSGPVSRKTVSATTSPDRWA